MIRLNGRNRCLRTLSSLLAQGPWGLAGRSPRGDGLTSTAHPRRDRDGVDRRLVPRRGTRGVRQDQHPRMGQPLHDRALAIREHGEPEVAVDHAGRVQRRVGRGGGGWTSLANVTGWAAISLPLGRHRGRSADRSSADGARRDDPAPARNGDAVVTSSAQYVMSLRSDGRPAWCATFVS
jgi:hypothetical protein